MTLKKDMISKGTVSKVTFYTHALPEAQQAYLVGDFNAWNESATPMSQLKDGRWKATVRLEPGQEYQFRYRIDGEWHNDHEADRYEKNEFGQDNSVVKA